MTAQARKKAPRAAPTGLAAAERRLAFHGGGHVQLGRLIALPSDLSEKSRLKVRLAIRGHEAGIKPASLCLDGKPLPAKRTEFSPAQFRRLQVLVPSGRCTAILAVALGPDRIAVGIESYAPGRAPVLQPMPVAARAGQPVLLSHFVGVSHDDRLSLTWLIEGAEGQLLLDGAATRRVRFNAYEFAQLAFRGLEAGNTDIFLRALDRAGRASDNARLRVNLAAAPVIETAPVSAVAGDRLALDNIARLPAGAGIEIAALPEGVALFRRGRPSRRLRYGAGELAGLEIAAARPGDHIIRLRAIDSAGQAGPFAELALTALEKARAPALVACDRVLATGQSLRLADIVAVRESGGAWDIAISGAGEQLELDGVAVRTGRFSSEAFGRLSFRAPAKAERFHLTLTPHARGGEAGRPVGFALEALVPPVLALKPVTRAAGATLRLADCVTVTGAGREQLSWRIRAEGARLSLMGRPIRGERFDAATFAALELAPAEAAGDDTISLRAIDRNGLASSWADLTVTTLAPALPVAAEALRAFSQIAITIPEIEALAEAEEAEIAAPVIEEPAAPAFEALDGARISALLADIASDAEPEEIEDTAPPAFAALEAEETLPEIEIAAVEAAPVAEETLPEIEIAAVEAAPVAEEALPEIEIAAVEAAPVADEALPEIAAEAATLAEDSDFTVTEITLPELDADLDWAAIAGVEAELPAVLAPADAPDAFAASDAALADPVPAERRPFTLDVLAERTEDSERALRRSRLRPATRAPEPPMAEKLRNAPVINRHVVRDNPNMSVGLEGLAARGFAFPALGEKAQRRPTGSRLIQAPEAVLPRPVDIANDGALTPAERSVVYRPAHMPSKEKMAKALDQLAEDMKVTSLPAAARRAAAPRLSLNEAALAGARTIRLADVLGGSGGKGRLTFEVRLANELPAGSWMRLGSRAVSHGQTCFTAEELADLSFTLPDGRESQGLKVRVLDETGAATPWRTLTVESALLAEAV